MNQITDWISHDGCWIRLLKGGNPDDIRARVALVEKTPRVRIREAHFREDVGYYEDGGKYVEYRWPEWLDWCYGFEGETVEESKQWCDNMLRAIGYQFPENK